MPSHKKHPVFIRIKTSDNEVICVQPTQLSSFRIKEKHEVKNRDGQALGTGDTIWLYLPSGTYTRYTVGMEITQEEFNYTCNTLREFLYLSEPEFKAKTAELDLQRKADWDAIMSDEDAEEAALTAQATPKV
jgi:hypothetical protein